MVYTYHKSLDLRDPKNNTRLMEIEGLTMQPDVMRDGPLRLSG